MSKTPQQELLEVKAQGYDLMLQMDQQFRQITQLNDLVSKIAQTVGFDPSKQKPEELLQVIANLVAQQQPAPQA